MFPNDLWQSHLLTRPALGSLNYSWREEIPGVQLDRSNSSSCAVQGGVCAYVSISPFLVVPVTANQAVPAEGSCSPWRAPLTLHPSKGQGLIHPTCSPSGKTQTTLCVHCSFPNSVIHYAQYKLQCTL